MIAGFSPQRGCCCGKLKARWHYAAADGSQPFLRRAVISVGHGAALQLRRDAPAASMVELKRDWFIFYSLYEPWGVSGVFCAASRPVCFVASGWIPRLVFPLCDAEGATICANSADTFVRKLNNNCNTNIFFKKSPNFILFYFIFTPETFLNQTKLGGKKNFSFFSFSRFCPVDRT